MSTSNYFNNGERKFVFENVFNGEALQKNVFDGIGGLQLCHEFLEGTNCNIVVYGPTCTGKTFTMEGQINKEKKALD